MKRLLLALPLILGILIGFTSPSDSATTRTYTASILPASGSTGQSPRLNCGFHGGSCGTGSGDFLDWDNVGSNSTTYFRGIFKRSGASTETGKLKGFQMEIGSGSQSCDTQDVAIVNTAGATILGYMRYMHTSTSSTGYFSLTTSSSGVYNSKSIGNMTNDSDCGAWNGTHVHAGFKPGSYPASRSKNTSLYPTGDYCDFTSSHPCGTYTNNSSSYWTHKFTWTGP